MKVDKSDAHEIIPVTFDLQEILHVKHSGAPKVGITEGKVHGHDKTLLPHIKPEETAKVISNIPSSSDMAKPHLVTNLPFRRDWTEQVWDRR